MTERELKRIEKTLNMYEKAFRNRALELFEKLTPELKYIVERTLRTGNVESFEMPGRKRYISLFEKYIRELYVQGMNLADKEIEAKRQNLEISFAWSISGEPVPPENAIKWMDSWTKHFGNDYYDDVTGNVQQVMKNALQEGATVNQTMDALGEYLSGPTYNKARLENIARTNATTAFNQGRLEMFRAQKSFVPAVEFMAILDSRVTDICESRNGKIMMLDDPALPANTPPLHYHCRSVLSPVTQPEWEEMQEEGWEDGSRGAVGGKTLAEKMDWSEANKKDNRPEKGFGSIVTPKTDKELLTEVHKILQDEESWTRENRLNSTIHVGDTISKEIDVRQAHIRGKLDRLGNKIKSLSKKYSQATLEGNMELAVSLEKKIANTLKQEEILFSDKDKALTNTLKGLRNFGNTGKWKIQIGTGSKNKVPLIKNVNDLFPSDWWREVNNSESGLKIRTIFNKSDERSYYNPNNKALYLRSNVNKSIVSHEMGHLFSDYNKDLSDLSNEYLFYRSNNGTNPVKKLSELTGLNYKKNEIAYDKTGFVDHYMAKIYGSAPEYSGNEIVSMGVQGLYFNEFNMLEKDPETVKFIIGLLISY